MPWAASATHARNRITALEVARRLNKNGDMSSNTLICGNRERDGQSCGELSLVHDIRFVYERDPPVFGDPPIEAECDIECPRCGFRRQVVGDAELS